MAGYEERRAAFSKIGVSLLAGTSEPEDKVLEVAATLGFPVAHSVTQETADQFGGFWEPRRGHIQPSEFILTQSGRVMASTYSTSPVGRMDPEETLFLTKIIASRLKK